MKRIKILVVLLLIVLTLSSCDRVRGANDVVVNPVMEAYCGVYLTTDMKKNLSVDRDIVIVPYRETVKDFYNRVGADNVEVTDSQGNKVSDDILLSTGFLVNTEYYNFYVVVLGDVDGDGRIMKSDSAMAEKYFLGEEKANALPYVVAADVDLSGKVDMTDVGLIELGLRSSSQPLGWYYEAMAMPVIDVTYEECSLVMN